MRIGADWGGRDWYGRRGKLWCCEDCCGLAGIVGAGKVLHVTLGRAEARQAKGGENDLRMEN